MTGIFTDQADLSPYEPINAKAPSTELRH